MTNELAIGSPRIHSWEGVTELKLDILAKHILLLAGQGKRTSQIALILNINRVIITQRLKTLEKYGYLNRFKAGNYTQITLNNPATALIAKEGELIAQTLPKAPVGITHPLLAKPQIPPAQPIGAPQAASQPAEQIPKRLHDLEVSFKLLSTLSPDEPPQVAIRSKQAYEEVKMAHHTDAILKNFKLKIRLYPTTVVVYAPDTQVSLESKIGEAISKSLDAVEETINDFEAKMNLKVKRLDKDTLIGKIITQHIALVNHPFAQWLRTNKMKIKVEDPDGGEPLLIFDYSHGKDELESENLINGENVMKGFTDLTLLFSKGKLDTKELPELKGMLSEMIKAIGGLQIVTQNLAQQAQSNIAFVSSHNQLIKDIDAYLVNPTVSEKMKANIHKRVKQIEQEEQQASEERKQRKL